MDEEPRRRWSDAELMLIITAASALVMIWVLYLVGGFSRSTG